MAFLSPAKRNRKYARDFQTAARMASTAVTPAETVINLYRKKLLDTKFRDDVALEREDLHNVSSKATSIGQRRMFMNSCGVDDDEVAHLHNEARKPP